MSNPSGQKGTAWKTACQRWLNEQGIAAGDMNLHGRLDRGDLSLPNVTVECKNDNSYALSTWVEEMKAETANNGHDFGFVIAHRRGKASPADAYVITTGRLWVPVLARVMTWSN